MKSALLEKENRQTNEQILQEIKGSISDDLISILVEAEKGITLCDLILDRLECFPSCGDTKDKDDLNNCLYIMRDLFKNITKQENEIQEKYL